jgi:cytochrome P450
MTSLPSVHQTPRDPAFYANPYPFYRRLHDAGGTVFWEDFGFLCFARHADVTTLLRDKRFGRQILHVMSREDLGWKAPPVHTTDFEDVERFSLLSLEPPDHTRLRTLVNRAFVSRSIDRLRPGIEQLCHDLIDGFDSGAIDLIARYGTIIPVTVIADLIGVPRERCPDLLHWSNSMVRMYQFNRDRAVEDAANTASIAFRNYLRDLIRDRRKHLGDDLISQLITAESAEGKLSEDEMISTIILLLNAGHEATVHVIGNGLLALLSSGADRSVFLGAGCDIACEELMRFDTPLHMFTRYALEDVQYGSVMIQKGQEIGLLLAAANRDPLVYPDPDTLRLDRQAAMHTSFGGGIHFCIGAPLARMEISIAMRILSERKPGLTIDSEPKFRDSYHFRGLERLLVS